MVDWNSVEFVVVMSALILAAIWGLSRIYIWIQGSDPFLCVAETETGEGRKQEDPQEPEITERWLWKQNRFDMKWIDFEQGRFEGFRTSKPREGDLIETPMQSGKMALSVFRKIEPQGDPQDMFFADCEHIGYSDEPEAVKLLAQVVPKPELMFL